MAKNTKKKVVGLKCTVCGNRNYSIYKPGNLQEKLEVSKYCPKCGKHTKHVETKAWN